MAADGGDTSQYWALKPAGELAGAVKEKVEAYFEAVRRRGLDRIWAISYAQAFGTDPVNPSDFATQTLAYTGVEGKELRWRINEPRALIDQANIIARGERPAFKCLALNDDMQSGAPITMAQNVVDYVYHETVGDQRESELTEYGMWFAWSAWWTRWDVDGGDDVPVQEEIPGLPQPVTVTKRSGSPKTTTLFPWEYAQEPYSKDSPWGCVRERISKWELAAAFPEQAERIRTVNNIRAQPAAAEMFVYDIESATTDDVILLHFYVKPCAAVPRGRYCGFVEDIPLWDRPCPHPKKIPIVEYCPHRYFGTRMGYSKAWDILALQEAVDELVSQVLTNYKTFGMQNVFVPAGTNFDEDALRDGQNIFTLGPGDQVPIALALAAMPDGYQWVIEFAYKRMDSIMGLNPSARGMSDEGVDSGNHAALKDAIAIRFQNAEHAALIQAREEQVNLSLDMVRQYAMTPFLVEIAGEGEQAYLKQFSKESISGVRRVRVVNVSPAMQSLANRYAMFEQVMKLPVEERGPAMRGLETGDFTGFTEPERTTDMLVRWENEQLIKGIAVKPMAGENPFDHLPKHWSELEKLRSQDATDQTTMVAIKMLTDHINSTIPAWMLTDPFLAMFLKLPQPPPVPFTPAEYLAKFGIVVPNTAPITQLGVPQGMGGAASPQAQATDATSKPSGDGAAGKEKNPQGESLPRAAQPPKGSAAVSGVGTGA